MGIFNRKVKKQSLKAFVSGELIQITEVNDRVFASKTLGNGIAIKPEGKIVTAPCAGEISMVAEESKHAIGMTLNNGAEILIHVGLDTVTLNGEGFKVFVKAGKKVKQGDKLMEFNKTFIESKGFDTTVVLVVTNSGDYTDLKFSANMNVVQNETEIGMF